MRLDRTLISKVLTEFVGTFTLTAIIIVMAQTIGQPFLTGLAAALVLATFYTTASVVSGAHLNPAVTLGMFSLRKTKLGDAVAFIVFQLVGAFAALRLVEYMYGAKLPGANKMDKFNAKIFVAELVGTAVFTWGVARVINKKVEGYQAAAAIGTSLFLGIMLAGMTAGAGFVNPAVAFGNKALNLNTAVAPLVAAVFAMNLVNILDGDNSLINSLKLSPAKASSPTTRKKPAAKKSASKKKK